MAKEILSQKQTPENLDRKTEVLGAWALLSMKSEKA